MVPHRLSEQAAPAFEMSPVTAATDAHAPASTHRASETMTSWRRASLQELQQGGGLPSRLREVEMSDGQELEPVPEGLGPRWGSLSYAEYIDMYYKCYT